MKTKMKMVADEKAPTTEAAATPKRTAKATAAKKPRERRPRRARDIHRDRRREMTTADAAEFLGVSIKTIGFLHWKFLKPEKVRPDQRMPWMPKPLHGSEWTETGVYAAKDIHALDLILDAAPVAVAPKRKKSPNRKPIPPEALVDEPTPEVVVEAAPETVPVVEDAKGG